MVEFVPECTAPLNILNKLVVSIWNESKKIINKKNEVIRTSLSTMFGANEFHAM